MANLSEAKVYVQKAKNNIGVNLKNSDPFLPEAMSEYDKKKYYEKKELHEEILRASMKTIDV